MRDTRSPAPSAMLTTARVADMLGITPSTWRAHVSRGTAPVADAWADRRTPMWHEATITREATRRAEAASRRKGKHGGRPRKTAPSVSELP